MRVIAAALVVGFSSLAGSTAARAQNTSNAVVSAKARCAAVTPIGSRVDTIFATVAIEPAGALPAGWDELLLTGIAQYFRTPASLDVPVVGGMGMKADMVSVLKADTVSVHIDGQVITTLRRDGTLRGAQVTSSTLSSALDQQLLATVRSLDSSEALPPFPSHVKADSVRVRFTMSSRVDRGVAKRALFVAQQPTWLLERHVSPRRGNPGPRYPAIGERARVGDTVLTSFVVDTSGKARIETIRIHSGRYREFQLAALKVLPRMRFDPARIAGCPVLQRVEMPFHFRIP